MAKHCMQPLVGLTVAVVMSFFAGAVRASELRLMTFNIKGDAATLFDIGNREKSWKFFDLSDPFNPIEGPHRRDRAISVIRQFGPDILGVQELKNNQRNDLSDAFPEFGFYGQGREGGNSGDRNGIYYRTSRFDLIDQGDFWLSETPTVPGTTFQGFGGDLGNPRMATWVKLFDQQTDKTYFVLNTHWSLDSLARRQSAALIQEMLPGLAGNLPILLLGDLNATRHRSEYATLRGLDDPGDVPLDDSFVDGGGVDGRSFHNFNGGVSGSRIDHILHTSQDFEGLDASIVRTTFDNGLFPSDHYPVTVTLLVVPEPSARRMAEVFIGLLGLARLCEVAVHAARGAKPAV